MMAVNVSVWSCQMSLYLDFTGQIRLMPKLENGAVDIVLLQGFPCEGLLFTWELIGIYHPFTGDSNTLFPEIVTEI